VRTLKILLAYDGTSLVGWQRQAHGVSVQGLLEDALSRIEHRAVDVVGAGRTDAGVHAAAQTASARVETLLDVDALRRALNAMLPVDVRVLRVEDAPLDFHARYSATGKTYHYRVFNGPVVPPFAHRWVWHVPSPLDVEAMDTAARLLVGEHDFAAFQSTGSGVTRTVRRLTESKVRRLSSDAMVPTGNVDALIPATLPIDGDLVTYEVTGTGFLRHMVRAILGTLVEIGRGRASPSLIADLLSDPARSRAGPTAPAAGLCLASVAYDGAHEPVATQR
jgi:tRNA pseudouridine38-40 synthase